MSREGIRQPAGIAASIGRARDPERRIWPLAGLSGERPPQPDWYRRAMAVPMEEHRIEVEGAAIEMLCWGEKGRPGILLVHGSGAHARWWGPVAPMLARDHRVVSFSWGGTGGSEWRPRYAVAQIAREAWAVAAAGGLLGRGDRPMLAAHSFGGKIGALVAAERGDALCGTVLIDSLVLPDEDRPAPPSYRDRHYASIADALARFRLMPDQPAGHPCIADDIARAALREVDGGWRWRFDPGFYERLDFTSGWGALTAARCPLAFIRGADSVILLDEDVATQRAHVAPGTVFLDIPAAGHHVMVDQPVALATALAALSATWRR